MNDIGVLCPCIELHSMRKSILRNCLYEVVCGLLGCLLVGGSLSQKIILRKPALGNMYSKLGIFFHNITMWKYAGLFSFESHT